MHDIGKKFFFKNVSRLMTCWFCQISLIHLDENPFITIK